MVARGYLGGWAGLWGGLTPSERSDWDTFAASPPETDFDRFGAVVLRSGHDWFIRLNQRRALLGGSPVLLAPASVPQTAPVLTSVTFHTPISGNADAVLSYPAGTWGVTDLAVLKVAFDQSVGVQRSHRRPVLLSFNGLNGTTSCQFGLVLQYRAGNPGEGWQGTMFVYRQNPDGIRSVVAKVSGVVTT